MLGGWKEGGDHLLCVCVCVHACVCVCVCVCDILAVAAVSPGFPPSSEAGCFSSSVHGTRRISLF